MKHWQKIVYWSCIWGITEAVLGMLLHLLPIGIGWMVWFPLAFYFMDIVYRQTGKSVVVFYAALLSAAIKLIDLLLPVRIDMVINPVVSIVFEGLAVFAALTVMSANNNKLQKALLVLGSNTAWRVLYISYILLMPEWMRELSPIRAVQPFVEFMVIQNLITCIIIYACLCIPKRITNKQILTDTLSKKSIHLKLKPSLQLPALMVLLLLNLFVQFVL